MGVGRGMGVGMCRRGGEEGVEESMGERTLEIFMKIMYIIQ